MSVCVYLFLLNFCHDTKFCDFQEYNDTLLITYLAMFTNCSRYGLLTFVLLIIVIKLFYSGLEVVNTTDYDFLEFVEFGYLFT